MGVARMLDDVREFWFGHERAFRMEWFSPTADCEPFNMYEACFYMLPLEHSEEIEDQNTFVSFIVSLAGAFGDGNGSFIGRARDIAVRHRSVIERFGRFPHRNDALGRPSSHEERVFLSLSPAGF